MKQNKKELFLGYFALVYALTLLFILINNFSGRNVEHWRFFYAFTQQSNILVLIWLVLFGLSAFGFKKFNKVVKNKVVMTALAVYISITYFIVALVLNPIYSGSWNPVSSANELWLHHLTPIIYWLMFFLVKGQGSISYKSSVLTLIYPLFYVLLNLVIGATLSYNDGSAAYAYDFINPNSYGNIFIYLLVILGLLLVFSLFSMGLTKLKLYIDNNYFNE